MGSYEKNLFSQVNNKPEVFVATILKDLEIKRGENYPENTLFVHKDTGEVWMEDDKKSGNLYLSQKHVWLKIKSGLPYKQEKICEIIKYTTEIAFKMKVGRPLIGFV